MVQPVLLERADELGLLLGHAAEVAASGRGQVVLVFGEAKTVGHHVIGSDDA